MLRKPQTNSDPPVFTMVMYDATETHSFHEKLMYALNRKVGWERWPSYRWWSGVMQVHSLSLLHTGRLFGWLAAMAMWDYQQNIRVLPSFIMPSIDFSPKSACYIYAYSQMLLWGKAIFCVRVILTYILYHTVSEYHVICYGTMRYSLLFSPD